MNYIFVSYSNLISDLETLCAVGGGVIWDTHTYQRGNDDEGMKLVVHTGLFI